MAEEQPSASEQELVEQLQAELGRLKVADLLLQTVYTISSLGYHRLSGENKDLLRETTRRHPYASALEDNPTKVEDKPD